MNRNLQVTRRDYADCVVAQYAFLNGMTEAAARVDIARYALATKHLDTCYDNGVSVDACACAASL